MKRFWEYCLLIAKKNIENVECNANEVEIVGASLSLARLHRVQRKYACHVSFRALCVCLVCFFSDLEAIRVLGYFVTTLTEIPKIVNFCTVCVLFDHAGLLATSFESLNVFVWTPISLQSSRHMHSLKIHLWSSENERALKERKLLVIVTAILAYQRWVTQFLWDPTGTVL